MISPSVAPNSAKFKGGVWLQRGSQDLTKGGGWMEYFFNLYAITASTF